MQSINLKYWWTFFLRGCIAVMFGFIAFFLIPILELGTMIPFFGGFILIQGVLAFIAYLMINKNKQSLPVLVESVLGISVGTFLVLLNDFNEALLIVSFITWGISAGICKVIRAAFLYRNQKFYVLLGINGLLSILLNLMIYVQAAVTITPLTGILSIYFVVYGTLLIIFGVRLKTSREDCFV